MSTKLALLTVTALAFALECHAAEPMRERADALKGKVETIDIDPAGMNGSIGIVSGGFLRNVTCGNHFYVVKDNDIVILGDEHARWHKWYQELCTRIARKWCEHTVIGNVQVTAVLGPDQKFREISIHACAPAIGRDGLFHNSPQDKDACEKAAVVTLRSMEVDCPELQFPPNAKSKAVVMSLTLSADADAVLPYPDLSPVALIPHDQKLQRLARTADILDTGGYVRTAAFVRRSLPRGMQEQLIGDRTDHSLDMVVDEDLTSCSSGMAFAARQQSAVAAYEEAAERVLGRLIAAHDYVSAEEFAKRLVSASSGMTPDALSLLLEKENVYVFRPITKANGCATIKFGGNMLVSGFKEARPNPTPAPAQTSTAAPAALKPAPSPALAGVLAELSTLNQQIKDCYARQDLEAALPLYKRVIGLLASSNANPQALATARKNYTELLQRVEESRVAKSISLPQKPTGTTRDTGMATPGGAIQRGTGIVGFKFIISIGKPPMINRVYPNTPAFSSGIQRGDFIESVNGTSTKGLTEPGVYALITGAPGTVVDFVLLRDSSQFRVQCTRMDLADIEDPVVKHDYLTSHRR